VARRISVLLAFLVLVLLGVGSLFAQQKPVDIINPQMHPHLAKAQRLCDQAFNALVEAQGANDFDMEGHAAEAKELLAEASRQMKAAAMAANKEGKGKNLGPKVPGVVPQVH
jgi:ABC-type uncharacterized transport system substrate-binding protein